MGYFNNFGGESEKRPRNPLYIDEDTLRNG